MNAIELLDQYRTGRSDGAFADLVRRYANLVYSVARRRSDSDASAQEIAQIVFIRLAQTSPKLRDDSELVGWLHRTAVNASIDLWRSETRRRSREELAIAMQTTSPTPDTWTGLAPVIDEALNELSDPDRRALLLRYFDRFTMRDLGVAFGVSEDAAKMRVSRALDRLREQLSRHGVSCAATAVGTLLVDHAVEAAPAGWAETLSSVRYPAAAVTSGGLLGFLWGTSAGKVAAGVAAIGVLGGLVTLAVRSYSTGANSGRAATVSDPPSIESVAAAAGAKLTATNHALVDARTPDTNAGDPDPLTLLVRVSRARQEIQTGTMEYNLFAERFDGHVPETNYWRFKTAFDGSKLWLESFGREYAYAQVGGDAGKVADPIIKAQGLDREGAVRAGLLRASEKHIVTSSDGTTWMKYRESDGRPSGTIIDDPAKGSGRSADYFFDFRCLGLHPSLSYGSTIEACLGYRNPKSIQLIGRDAVEGAPAWHVRVVTTHGYPFDFWIDVARPERVLKSVSQDDTVISRYSPSGNDPIPLEVWTTLGRLKNRNHLTRVNAGLHVPVDPATWGLTGLGMPVGTVVTDLRIQRSIGYWDGSGLSSNPGPAPSARARNPRPPAPSVDRTEVLATLESVPASEEGLKAAEWILLNSPDGPDVEKAAAAVYDHHLTSPHLLKLTKGLERLRPKSAHGLLEGILATNPKTEIRAAACFTLAAIAKDASEHGRDRKRTAEAEKLMERIITEFADVKPDGPTMAQRARFDLGELRLASLGKPAPELVADDLQGNRVRLVDHRGRVVLVMFWWSEYERSALRSVMEGVDVRSVDFIGVGSHDKLETMEAEITKNEVKWPQIWDRRDGPLAAAWFVRSWPSIFVIDPEGIIRYRGPYTSELHKTLRSLVGSSAPAGAQ